MWLNDLRFDMLEVWVRCYNEIVTRRDSGQSVLTML